MKKTLITLLTTSVFLPFTPAYALSDIESLAIFQTNVKKNAAAIWPGLAVGNRPMIAATSKPGDSLYAFDLQTQNTKWQKQIIQSVPVHYMQHDSVGANAFLNNANISGVKFFMLENKPATVVEMWESGSSFSDNINKQMMLMSYYLAYELHDSPYANAKLNLFNQIFHGKQIQFDSFNNPEIFSLLHLEVSVLKEYLTTQNVELLKTFAAIQQYRTQLLNDNARQYEISEDFPLCFYYIYYKALETSGIDSGKAILNDRFKDDNNDFIIPSDFNEQYHDMLDAIYITEQYVMDKLVPDWKTTVEANNTVPTSIFMQHYSMSADEAKTLTNAAKARYGYAEFIQKINEKLQPYLREMEELQAAYDKQTGIEFIFKRQEGAQGGSISTLSKEYQIDSLTTMGTASESFKTHDSNLDFSAENMTIYSMSQQDYYLKFKLTPDTILNINGGSPTPLQKIIQAGKSIKVNQITITGNGENPLKITLKMTKSAGTLSVVDGKVVLNYTTK